MLVERIDDGLMPDAGALGVFDGGQQLAQAGDLGAGRRVVDEGL